MRLFSFSPSSFVFPKLAQKKKTQNKYVPPRLFPPYPPPLPPLRRVLRPGARGRTRRGRVPESHHPRQISQDGRVRFRDGFPQQPQKGERFVFPSIFNFASFFLALFLAEPLSLTLSCRTPSPASMKKINFHAGHGGPQGQHHEDERRALFVRVQEGRGEVSLDQGRGDDRGQHKHAAGIEPGAV